MMQNLFKILLGLNGASLIRGIRLGFLEFVQGCSRSFSAVHPRQDKQQCLLERELKRIPEISLIEILGSRKALIKLTLQAYEDGMMPSHEAMALVSILVAEQPKEVLEIGTFMGHTTRAMAENLPNATIHSIDLPPDFQSEQDRQTAVPKDDFHLISKRVVGREFKGQEVAVRIKQHFGDTALMDFEQIGRPTFFFIDGSHTYEYCKQDSEKCLALCKASGVFLWHDCDVTHSGVIKFLQEWRNLGRDIRRITGTAIAYWKAP